MIVLAWIVFAIALTLAALAAWRVLRQRGALAEMKLTGPAAIDEAGFVQIGGIPQWLSIRGEDRANPVLVILHGGPGSAFQMLSYRLFRPWERRFTVVQWDQRGAGRTFALNGKASGQLTIDRFVRDGVEVIEHALARTGQPKALVLGISWGSMLGVGIARRRPDLLHAYVGGGQVVDMPANEAVGYDLLLDRIRARGDHKSEAKLQAIGPPPYAGQKQLIAERAVLFRHPPASERTMIRQVAEAMIFAPQAGLKDVAAWFRGQGFSIDHLYDEMFAWSDLEAPAPFEVPVVIIQGGDDIQTPTVLARRYFDKLQAPSKQFVVVPGGGHSMVIAMPDAFLAALEEHARPLAP